MKTILILILFISSLSLQAQVLISGNVVDEKGEPVPGVNIYIENTYDGASSDSLGSFRFKTTEKGVQKLAATFIGYQKWVKEINLDTPADFRIILKESINTIDAVTITAGSFAAGDNKRAAVMEPLDVYTTASATGDIMGAMRTMPGTQAGADDGRLMVRGGDAYETHTFIDGLVTAKPYFSKTPDIATRGRFAPSLFSGVVFNSGGYSAEYGQALSSVLILNSNDMATEDVTGISVMIFGGELNRTKRWKNSSLSLNGSYMNFAPYREVFKSSLDWEKPVESGGVSMIVRQKDKSGGMWKGYINGDFGRMGYRVSEGNDGTGTIKIANNGENYYSNFTYRNKFSEKKAYRIGLSATYDHTKFLVGNKQIEDFWGNTEARFTVVHDLKEGMKITCGMSGTFDLYRQKITVDPETTYEPDFDELLSAGFVETEVMFTKNLAIRPGLRAEYSAILNKMNIAPRVAFAVNTWKDAQLSAAFGLYHQTPQKDYLKVVSNLDFEKATHYILSFQSGKMDERLFRTEVYYKTYRDLITYTGNEYYPVNISNSGNGYATGIDVFWRDQESLPGFDYWITYSFIDTERKYKYYPEKVTPDFISKHNFSVVGKYWLAKISTQVGMAYTYASGRPYNDPNSIKFMDKMAKAYSDLSLNLSHVFYIGNQYSVLYCSVSNVLGRDNIFGYRPTGYADAQGNYTMIPVKQDLKRMVFIGLFLNI